MNEEVIIETYSFQDYFDSKPIEGDLYGILSLNNIENKCKVLAKSPYLIDKTKRLLTLARVNGVLAGFLMSFPTKLKAGDKVLDSLGGSSLYVHESFRHLAVGAQLLLYKYTNREADYFLSAGFSKMAMPIQKKLKSVCFEFPVVWQPRNLGFLFQMKGLRGWIYNILTWCSSLFISFLLLFVRLKNLISYRKYTVSESDYIPDWIPDLACKDKRKYTEYHDKKWFDWVLNNNFKMSPEDNQHLFVIKKNGCNIGYYLTKERTQSIPQKYISKVTFGTITEWGIVNEGNISESDLYNIALGSFSKNVDIVECASTNAETIREMKRSFFFKHGSANFSIRDYSKQLTDVSDANQWRFRIGFSDVMFF